MDLEAGGDVAESIGPIQLWSVAFEGNQFRGEILPELERLKKEGIVRMIDLLFVRKDSEGAVMVSTQSDLDWAEAVSLGLVPRQPGRLCRERRGRLRHRCDRRRGGARRRPLLRRPTTSSSSPRRSPTEPSAAVALLEHLWAKPLVDAIDRANGTELESRLLRPEQVFTPSRLLKEPPRPLDTGEPA